MSIVNGPAEMHTLEEFTGTTSPLPIYIDSELPSDKIELIDRLAESLNNDYGALGTSGSQYSLLPQRDFSDCKFWLSTSDQKGGDWLVATLGPSEDFVGGVGGGVPFIAPQFRGQNLGVALVAADYWHELMLFNPTSYSLSGFNARKAFHRQQVVTAKLEGRPVHPKNLVRYASEIGAALHRSGTGQKR